MADINDAVSSILNDPNAMKQIKELGAMLGLGGEKPAEKPSASPLGALTSAGDADTLNMMMKLAPLLSSFNEENDSTRLLNALRPFLSEKRRVRIDGSIRLLSLMRILPLLKGVF